tara:strand:- start:2075 stop:3463 length:1389 start_codon:yes stop_codon:yes gene_type:complete
MGCKSSKLAELREAQEELAAAGARVKELEAAQLARKPEVASKRKSRGGGRPNLASSSSTADSLFEASRAKTDSLSQAMAEVEEDEGGERSPRDKLLTKFAAKEAAANQARQSKVVAPEEVSPEISPPARRRRSSKESRTSKERLGDLALSIERSSPILEKAARRRRSSKEASAEAIAEAAAARSQQRNAPPAQPEAPTPTAVRDLMATMGRAGRKFAEDNPPMSLEQELAERMSFLASKLGMEEAALAEAESFEYADAALSEEDIVNLLTILGKGGLPRLEMVGAIPVGALVSDALVELRLCELELKPLGVVGGMILAGLLPAATKLRSVNLEDSGLCGADMSGFQLFVESLAETKIRRLNLSSNGLGDAGARALAGVLKRCHLTHLYLAGNELCGVNMFRSGTHVTGGLRVLCAQIPDTQIEHLDLSFNSIREAGGAHVVEMLETPDDTPYLQRSTVRHAI